MRRRSVRISGTGLPLAVSRSVGQDVGQQRRRGEHGGACGRGCRTRVRDRHADQTSRGVTHRRHAQVERKPMAVDRKPMTARSVVASTLLGVEPPRLTTRILVRSGELFGIAEGTTRVALSRMVAAGELRPDDDGYRLGRAACSTARPARPPAAGRRPSDWDGTWELAVVRPAGARRAADRAALRLALSDLRMAELRDADGFDVRGSAP